ASPEFRAQMQRIFAAEKAKKVEGQRSRCPSPESVRHSRLLHDVIGGNPRLEVVLNHKPRAVDRTFPKLMTAVCWPEIGTTVLFEDFTNVSPVIRQCSGRDQCVAFGQGMRGDMYRHLFGLMEVWQHTVLND